MLTLKLLEGRKSDKQGRSLDAFSAQQQYVAAGVQARMFCWSQWGPNEEEPSVMSPSKPGCFTSEMKPVRHGTMGHGIGFK